MGNYRFTVLGQGICSSQDLFNFIIDGGTKLDEDFNCLKNIDNFLLFIRLRLILGLQLAYIGGYVGMEDIFIWPVQSRGCPVI